MPCHESNHGDFFFQIYTEYHLHGIPHEFNTLRLSPDGSNGARCYCTHTPSFPHSLVNENQTNHQSKRQMFTVVVYNFNLQSVRQRFLPVSSADYCCCHCRLQLCVSSIKTFGHRTISCTELVPRI